MGSLAGHGYRYNASVERLRDTEYPMLKDAVYLDHAGAALCPRSLMDSFTNEMTTSLFGNPHSASASSQLSTSRVENIRLRVLQFFNADPSEFDVVFVANATAGIKLVVEALRAAPGGFDYVYHQASHTSLVGAREEARNSLCVDDDLVNEWIKGASPLGNHGRRSSTALFAYPAQSNMDGQRFPLDWPSRLRASNAASEGPLFTLLDAAAFASTSPLDLSDSESAPDFTVVSFYKIFGFPDLGALLVRLQAEPVFTARKYFGGGTVDTVVCIKEQWRAPKSHFLHERLEDGTLPFHSIIALDAAIGVHARLFGTMRSVASHVSFLAQRLYNGLRELRHGDSSPVCTIYPQHRPRLDWFDFGPAMAFNLRNQAGAWISLAEFEKLAGLKKFHVRTGGLCNPGGIASALGLEPWEIRRNFSSGFRCGTENDIVAGKPTGVIRLSLGAASTISDVDSFIAFIKEFYCDPVPQKTPPGFPTPNAASPNLYVSNITIYPIKSCGGFAVPRDTSWEVRPEGLTWDREWCLVHRGTAQALSQKRFPKMALIRPILDFESGRLRINYYGVLPRHLPPELSVPLSANPALFKPALPGRSISRVCGEEVVAQTYVSEDINNFFSVLLGVPCVLARFPPGGQGKSMRHSKAQVQRHQSWFVPPTAPGMLSASPSPADPDVEQQRPKILLSNESPILAINLCSLRALNQEIARKGGEEVSPTVFRANIVLDSSDQSGDRSNDDSYAEDGWSKVRIGRQEFAMLGSCRRCHMICINQETAEKSEEPFVTLSKTRRFDGKVFFGTHMGLAQGPSASSKEAQHPTIRVGDPVSVES